jgi:hypothetical protein
MRMWMVDVKKMCDKHLLGEHVECHMIVGSIEKSKNLEGFFINNCIEPLSIKKRHDEIANEMTNRGFNHKSFIIKNPNIEYLKERKTYIINKDDSFKMLYDRCDKCRSRIK